MSAVDVSEPVRPPDSEPEPEPGSRLWRRHQRLRALFWLLVAAALLAGFGLGVAIGRGEARKMTSSAPADAPAACVEAVRQAEEVTRKGIRVQQTASRYLSVAGRYEAGILDGHQTLRQVAALGTRTRADAVEFLGALPAWQIARNHCNAG